MNDLWAVIPSCSRRELLYTLVSQLVEDGVRVVVVDTGYEPQLTSQSPDVTVLRDLGPVNISRWWNRGLDFVSTFMGQDDYVVAVLNDDIVVPPLLVQRLAAVIESTGAVAAYPDVYGVGRDYIQRDIPFGARMAGFAFALRGSAGIRADESLVWWYGDNDIDWQARQKGGVVGVGGLKIQHLYANSTTVGELADQAGRDRETFTKKWGQPPW